MIWFPCKKCGKTHGRADASAGAVIFCECGVSLRVPWESTTAAPPPSKSPPIPAEPLDPIRFEPTGQKPPESVPDLVLPGFRRAKNAPIDANVCFNHSSIDKHAVCPDCGLSFCERCLVTFQNKTLCAPCKNYVTRLLQRRPTTASLAMTSFLVALLAGPALLGMIPFTIEKPGRPFLLLALLPPLFAIATGIIALRRLRHDPEKTGQHLAISSLGLSSAICLLTVLLSLFGHKIWT